MAPSSMGPLLAIRQLAQLPDPLSQRQVHRALDEGLVLERSAFLWVWWG